MPRNSSSARQPLRRGRLVVSVALVVSGLLGMSCSSAKRSSAPDAGSDGSAGNGGRAGSGGAGAAGSSAGSGGMGGTGGSSAGSGGMGGAGGAAGSAGSGGSGGAGGTGGTPATACAKGKSSGAVQAPTFWKNLGVETSWFASPVVVDLDDDGKNELVAAYYSVFVYDDQGVVLRPRADAGRVYAPHVVADLDGDGVTEVVVGNGKNVIAYEWKSGKLQLKAGWPADTTSGGEVPEVRGMAAARSRRRRQASRSS